MSYSSGRDGSLYVNGIKAAKVASWSINASQDALEVTDLGVDDREFVGGMRSATGNAVIFYYDDAPVELLSKVIAIGGPSAPVQMSLRWGEKKLDFDALVTSGALACQVGAVMQANIAFSVTGGYDEVVL